MPPHGFTHLKVKLEHKLNGDLPTVFHPIYSELQDPIPPQPLSPNLSLGALLVTLNSVSSVIQKSANPADTSSHIKTL